MKRARGSSQRLGMAVEAVRELIAARLRRGTLRAEEQREVEMALEALDLVWEELQGRQAQQERESERYAELFDYAPDACLVTDAGGNVREANHAAAALFGAAREALAGRPIAALVPEEEKTALLAKLFAAAARPHERLAWTGRVLSRGEALEAHFSVRALPPRASGVGALCWLVRVAG